CCPARRVFASGRTGHPDTPLARTMRSAGRGRAPRVSGADALLSPRRAGGRARDHRASLWRRDRAHDGRMDYRNRGTLMLVVMKHGASQQEVDAVVHVIEEMGYAARPMPGAQRTAVGLVGNDGRVDASRIEALSGVAQVIHVTQPYKQVSREWQPEDTIVTLAPGVHVGGDEVVIMAGPC